MTVKNFVADASHELKTPLAILNANLSVLAENGTESVASQDQWISAMQVQITRMNGLINDMLTLAKLDHDQDAIPTRAVDFSRLTTGCLLSFEAVAYEKGVEIRSRISEHLMVNGSPERFSRLVDILLDNAVKHTPSGGIVEVVLSREKNHAVLSVRNSGEEISPMRSPTYSTGFTGRTAHVPAKPAVMVLALPSPNPLWKMHTERFLRRVQTIIRPFP